MSNKQAVSCKCGNSYTIMWEEDDWADVDQNPNFSPCCGEDLDYIDDEFEDDLDV